MHARVTPPFTAVIMGATMHRTQHRWATVLLSVFAGGLLGLMAQDKKVEAGRARFILLRRLGEAFVSADVPRAAVHALLSDALADRSPPA